MHQEIVFFPSGKGQQDGNGGLWLHQAAAAERLDRALTCLDHPPEAADLDALEQHLNAILAETK